MKAKLGPCLLSFLIFFTITSFLLPYIFADDEALSSNNSVTPSHLSLSSLLRKVSKNLEIDWKKKRRDAKLYPTDLAASLLAFRTAFSQSLDEKEIKEEEDEEEIVSVLLGALMSDRNDVEIASMLERSRSIVRPYFFNSRRMKRSSIDQKHEISALFVVVACRVFEVSKQQFGSGLHEDMILATNGLISRITEEGLLNLLDDSSTFDDINDQRRFFSTLRQGESIAALRCSGAILNQKEYLVAAERLRRGLFSFYSAVDENDIADVNYDSNLKSPFATSVTIDKAGNENRKNALSTQLPMVLLFLEHRDIPSQVIQEIAEMSSALVTPVGLKEEMLLDDVTFSKKSSTLTHKPSLSPWRVSPIEQAISFAGIVKHMLPLSGRLNAGGNSVGDEAGAGDLLSADSLSALIDGVLRVEQALVQLEGESASRMSDNVRQKILSFYKDLEAEPPSGIADTRISSLLRNTAKFQKRLGDTAAAAVLGKIQRSVSKRAGKKSSIVSEQLTLTLPSLPPAISTLLNASLMLNTQLDFNPVSNSLLFTFPEFLTPLHSSDRPVSPRLVADAAAPFSWPELRDGESVQGRTLRGELSDRLETVGQDSLASVIRRTAIGNGGTSNTAKTTSTSTSTTAMPPLKELAPLIEEIARGMRYPIGGLSIVRTQDAETEEEIIPEQVVVEVLRHQHNAAVSSVDEISGSNNNGDSLVDDSNIDVSSPQRLLKKDSVKHTNTILVRGNGRPFHLSTAVAAVFFRRLFENAYEWLKGRDALVLAEEKLKAKSRKDNSASPVKLWLSENNNDGSKADTPPRISSSAMQAFLHSGAADASLLAVDFEWLKDPLLSKYRNIRGGEELSMIKKNSMTVDTNNNVIEKSNERIIKNSDDISRMEKEENFRKQQQQQQHDEYSRHMKQLCDGGNDVSSDPSKSVWYKSCCLDIATASASDAASLPTFQCLSKEGDYSNKLLTLPCSLAEDDYCDCLLDGADEVTTSACSLLDDKIRKEPIIGFLCASGVKNDPPRSLSGGGQYISFTKVNDGVTDCIEEEDERK